MYQDENLHQHEYEIANDYWQLERTLDLDEVYAQNQEKTNWGVCGSNDGKRGLMIYLILRRRSSGWKKLIILCAPILQSRLERLIGRM